MCIRYLSLASSFNFFGGYILLRHLIFQIFLERHSLPLYREAAKSVIDNTKFDQVVFRRSHCWESKSDNYNLSEWLLDRISLRQPVFQVCRDWFSQNFPGRHLFYHEW